MMKRIKAYLMAPFKCAYVFARHKLYGDYRPLHEQSECLSICSVCPLNINGTCDDCGCVISEKVRMDDCPMNLWPEVNSSEPPEVFEDLNELKEVLSGQDSSE